MEIDQKKRRRIMQRSMNLGHCICDPKKGCPCDTFKDKGYCPCAGERPDPVPLENVRLMEMVHNTGCASKISPVDLEVVLARLPEVDDPAVLCGMPAGDDAGIYRLADGTCIVQTIDVMTPCVDDPETFGRICAANCLSDIYAMGGEPKTALSVLGFPSETHDCRIMYEMMKGAMDVFADAGVALIGGHSIKDDEIKLGFAITGTIDESRAARRDTAEVGDILVLTKPLGAGVLNFCRQIGRDVNLDQVIQSMGELNGPAAEAMGEAKANACTDITGFGLFGHLAGMVRSSGVTADIWADQLPAFEGAVEALADEVIPGAVERNTEFVAGDITVSDSVDGSLVSLGFDAQTSGGLLITVPEDRLEKLLNILQSKGVTGWVIGRITKKSQGNIVVTLKDENTVPEIKTETPGATPAEEQAPAPKTDSPCCAGSPDGEQAGGALRAFGSLMRATSAPGEIDEVTKELITFALVVMARCDGCFSMHYRKALGMGITKKQLEEAAWCAVAMGGAVVRVFYLEMLNKIGNDTGEGGCC